MNKPLTFSCPSGEKQVTMLLDLDVLTYFKKDGKRLTTRVHAIFRELAGLTLKKDK